VHIRLLCITHRVPAWVQTGYAEYSKRILLPYTLELIEIPAEKRKTHLTIKQILERETLKIFSYLKPHHQTIALDITGKLWRTEQLADFLKSCNQSGRTIDLIVGGPDGLSEKCLQHVHEKWSLSPLTFPHPLVRVLIAEQLYRATCILQNHPYHR
jgi:23S rRNA (pseudouridine1915-N3)-methyltransferase